VVKGSAKACNSIGIGPTERMQWNKRKRDNERTNEVYLPMNGLNNDWLTVEAEAHQSWPAKNREKTDKLICAYNLNLKELSYVDGTK